MKRKTRRKEGMPSKELVKLHVYGLGLEPRWLLIRLQNTFLILYLNYCQVFKKAEKNTTTVEASKVKEEKLEVAGGNGGKCWRGKLLSALCLTGEIFKSFPMKVLFEIFKVWETEWEYVVLNLK